MMRGGATLTKGKASTAALLVAVVLCAGPATAGDLVVMMDQAQIIKAPERTQTLVIGNPSIVDVSLLKNNNMVLTGKMSGSTNMIALDGAGQAIIEVKIHVQGNIDGVVTVQRGLDRESYSCSPTCAPTLQLGDSDKFFGQAAAQATARNSLAAPSNGAPRR